MPNTSRIRASLKNYKLYKTVIGVLVNTNNTGPMVVRLCRNKQLKDTCRLIHRELCVNQFYSFKVRSWMSLKTKIVRIRFQV